jgi:hypothetical protein
MVIVICDFTVKRHDGPWRRCYLVRGSGDVDTFEFIDIGVRIKKTDCIFRPLAPDFVIPAFAVPCELMIGMT